MIRKFVLRPEAQNDIAAAAQWYEEQRSGLSLEFRSALDQAFFAIESNPALYAPIYRELRRALLQSSWLRFCIRRATPASGALASRAPASFSLNADVPHAGLRPYAGPPEGSHRQFHRRSKRSSVTVSGKPSIDVPPGTLGSALKEAGLKKQER